MSKTRTIVLGLDACDQKIALALAAEGRMPVLASLLERGAWARVQNPPGLFVGAVWPSLYTGVSPATHGRYCFRQVVPGTYVIHGTSVATTVDARPFWAQLSDAGKRVAVLDVPHSFVVEDFNGIQLVDWGAHDANPGFQTSPAAMADEVRRFGDHPVGVDCNGLRETSAAFARLRNDLLAGIDLRVQMAEHFLDQEAWDLFVHVFSEAHCVGHQCWHLHDGTHPRHDPALVPETGDPLTEVYAALDAAVGRLIAHVGPDTTALLVFSHGMGPHYGANFLLDEVLRRLDVHAVGAGARLRARARQLIRRHARRALRSQLHSGRVERARSIAEEADVESTYARPLAIDPRTRRCFAVPNNDVCGAIRLNLRGREPHGIVDPDDYDAVCDAITQELFDLTNDESPHPPVVRVLRTRDVYEGTHAPDLPDLLVEWNWRAPIESVSSPLIGSLTMKDPENRTGDHRPEGLVVAVGPNVVPGQLGRVRSVDIAPTVAALCDVDLANVDGRSIEAIAGSAVRGR